MPPAVAPRPVPLADPEQQFLKLIQRFCEFAGLGAHRREDTTAPSLPVGPRRHTSRAAGAHGRARPVRVSFMGVLLHATVPDMRGLDAAPCRKLYWMSYTISVEDARGRDIYTNAFGGGGTVFQYWSTPAKQLGLPLIAAIYNEACTWSGHDLQRIVRELVVLEAYWEHEGYEGHEPYTSMGSASGVTNVMSTLEHLQERAGHLRTAVQLATEHHGSVSVS